MNNIIPASSSQLAAMDTASLRRELSSALQISAKQLVYLAAVWKELENRGEDLSDLKIGMGEYLPMIASGAISADAIVHHAGNRVLLNAIATLPLQEQNKLIQRGQIDIASIDEKGEIITASVPLKALRTVQIRQLFHGGKILNIHEQIKALPVKTEEPDTLEDNDAYIDVPVLLPPEDTVVKKARDLEVENGFIVIGRFAVSADEVLKVLKQHKLLPKSGKLKKQKWGWTEQEDEILLAHYPDEGIQIRSRLPGRTDASIFVRASKLGIKREG